jgi:RNA binding activity-knot of a chromodomain
MSIRFRCSCGHSLRAADDAVGTRIRCRECGDSVRVPELEEEDDRPRRRPRSRKAAGGSSALALYLILGGLLLATLVLGLYFAFGRSGPSEAERNLIGEWETDPQAAGNAGFFVRTKISFRADGNYQFQSIMNLDGRWTVVARDGNTLKVRLVHQVFGFDQDNPPTATITVLDPDHLEFAANHPSMMVNGKFRRVGTGPPAPTPLPKFDPPNVGRPGVAPLGPQKDTAVPDCEVLWNGTWFPAKVLKKENDRWFIHYVGWGANWDEWVVQARIRFPNGK